VASVLNIILKPIFKRPFLSLLVFMALCFWVKPDWGDVIMRIKDPLLVVMLALGATVWIVLAYEDLRRN
jgi:hypothetical protein